MGNITEWSQVSLDGVKKQVCECIEHAQAEGYKRGYTKGKNDGHAQGCHTQSEHDKAKIDEAKQEGYNEGLENARQVILKLLGINSIEYARIFNDTDMYYTKIILEHYSIKEIESKIRAYEEDKQAEEIKVGDEVCRKDRIDCTVVITGLLKEGRANAINFQGSSYIVKLTEYERTGRHFDEVVQLLDKLNEEIEDSEND